MIVNVGNLKIATNQAFSWLPNYSISGHLLAGLHLKLTVLRRARERILATNYSDFPITDLLVRQRLSTDATESHGMLGDLGHLNMSR